MKLATPIVIALLLPGCASAPATPAEYLLGGPTEASSQHSHDHADAVFARLSVADYLDRAEIVVETRDGVIQPAFSHRWAEPLAPALRRELARHITASTALVVLPDAAIHPPTEVDLIIERFHGSEDGRVVLSARWTVRRHDNATHHTMMESVRTSADGYAALVRAHDELILALARGIGQSLMP